MHPIPARFTPDPHPTTLGWTHAPGTNIKARGMVIERNPGALAVGRAVDEGVEGDDTGAN